ncbi:hypothetical protein Tco_1411817 [Tanacetum coccineum]
MTGWFIRKKNKFYATLNILVAKYVKGEEEIPDGAVSVIEPDMPDVLSHVSDPARNIKESSRPKATLADIIYRWPGLLTFRSEKILFKLTEGIKEVDGRARVIQTAARE